MTPAEKVTSLKVLAALAWADGVLTGQEIDSLVDFVSGIGPWQGREIKDVLRTQTELADETLRELAALSPPAVAALLSTANHMANAERPATEREQTIMRRVADATLGSDRWEQVSAWLQAELHAAERRRALFGESV